MGFPGEAREEHLATVPALDGVLSPAIPRTVYQNEDLVIIRWAIVMPDRGVGRIPGEQNMLAVTSL